MNKYLFLSRRFDRGDLSLLSASLVAFSALMVVLYVSLEVGFVSPDSWNYIRISESLSGGDGCSVRGEYFAVFPCGYPALISLFSLVSGLDAFSSSKFLNVILLSLSGALVYSATKNALAGLLVLLNPITLHIGHYTWSENAFLLSFSLVFYSVTIIHKRCGEVSLTIAGLLLFGLLSGISSRYFFGPYALFMFFCIMAIYGKKTSLKIFPYFAFAGVLFVAYYAFNKIVTGYGGGMPRIPSPESLVFLLAYFFRSSAKLVVACLVSLSPVFFLLFRHIYLVGAFRGKSEEYRHLFSDDFKPLLLLFLLGIAYLFLSFVMRIYVQYDLYGSRTIGYGFVFIFSSLVAIIAKLVGYDLNLRGSLIFLGVAIISLVLSQRDYYIGFLFDSREDYAEGFYESLDKYRGQLRIDGVVVPFNVPEPKWSVAANPDIFYSGDFIVIKPRIAPYWEKETFDEFYARALSYGMDCYYDFTRVSSTHEMQEILDAEYPVDLTFSNGIKPGVISEKRFHSSFKEKILEVFSPGKLVACGGNANN